MKGLTNLLRREFLKKAGLGSVALASLPSRGLGRAPTSRARAGSQPSDDNGGTTNWIVAAIENALTVNGVQYRMLLEGHGSVASDGTLQGQGSFVEIDNGTPVPHTILASGTWLATSLTSINIIGTYGSLAAGTIDMVIELVEDLPAPGIVSGVTLNIVCNIPAAGLFTGQPEGYFLTIPGSPSGTFQPPVVVGGTVYSILDESRTEPGD